MHVLGVILLALLGLIGILLLVVIVPLLLALRRLRRRNSLSPDHPSEAPLTWLWSPRMAARLHRRLQSAVAVARMIRDRHVGEPHPPAVVELATGLEHHAVALDRHLALVGRLAPLERKRIVTQLTAEVRRIEELASRLSLLEVDVAAPARLAHHPTAIQELSERLDHLEASRRDVRKVEADIGLTTTSPLPVERPAPEPRRARG